MVSTADVNIWTGLNDLGMQGFFTWSDGHWVSFTYWAPGEPNNHAGFKEDCVEILHEVRGNQSGSRHDFPPFPVTGEHVSVHCGCVSASDGPME